MRAPVQIFFTDFGWNPTNLFALLLVIPFINFLKKVIESAEHPNRLR